MGETGAGRRGRGRGKGSGVGRERGGGGGGRARGGGGGWRRRRLREGGAFRAAGGAVGGAAAGVAQLPFGGRESDRRTERRAKEGPWAVACWTGLAIGSGICLGLASCMWRSCFCFFMFMNLYLYY
jgi:hypothetical protein